MCTFCDLRMALTEVSVLQDVLNITKQKHYMVLDTVSAEAPEARTGLHLYAKKRVSLCKTASQCVYMLHTHVYTLASHTYTVCPSMTQLHNVSFHHILTQSVLPSITHL